MEVLFWEEGKEGEFRSRLCRKPSTQRMFKQVQIKIVETYSIDRELGKSEYEAKKGKERFGQIGGLGPHEVFPLGGWPVG